MHDASSKVHVVVVLRLDVNDIVRRLAADGDGREQTRQRKGALDLRQRVQLQPNHQPENRGHQQHHDHQTDVTEHATAFALHNK